MGMCDTEILRSGAQRRLSQILVLVLMATFAVYTMPAEAAVVLEQWVAATQQSNTVIEASFPTAPAEGNLLVAIVGNKDASDPPATPSGWVLEGGDSANSPGQLVYYKIAGAAESPTFNPGTYSIIASRGMHLYEYSGVDTGNPLASSVRLDGTGTTLTTGSINTSQDGSLILVGFTIAANTTSDGWTNGFVEEWDFTNGGAPAGKATYVGVDLEAGAAGTYSTSATTTVAGPWIGHVLVFNPDSPVTGTPPVAIDDPGGYAALLSSYAPVGWWRLGEGSGSTAVDLSPAANDGAYVSAFLSEPAVLVGDANTAMRLDGSGHVEISHDPSYLVDEGAVQFWMQVSAAPVSIEGIFSKDSNDFDTGGHLTVSLRSDGRIEARIQSTSETAIIAATSPLSANEWHHVLVAFGAAGFRLYVDGVLEASDPWTAGLGISSGGVGNREPIALGGSTVLSDDLAITPLNYPYSGWIDEVAILASPIADSDALALFLSGADRYETSTGAPLVVTDVRGVLRNDTDAEPGSLTASLISGPANAAAFTLDPSGSFTYTSSNGFSGTDSFVYEAVDSDLNTSQATASIEVQAAGFAIAGIVFEDVDFAGTALVYDGGATDAPLANVDVELYDDSDVFVTSTTTGADGIFNFTNVLDGNYKVRARSATLGDADTPPAGGLNASVPATWPYPIPEMTWGNGAAALGGQSPTADDSDIGDDLGPGDTWVSITISGADVSDVDFGFAYNLIVNTADDGLANATRSDQGSLRQFIKNANAIGTGGATTASSELDHGSQERALPKPRRWTCPPRRRPISPHGASRPSRPNQTLKTSPCVRQRCLPYQAMPPSVKSV